MWKSFNPFELLLHLFGFPPRDGIGTLRLWSNGLNTTVLNCIQNPAKPSRGWQHVYGITCSIWKDQSWVGENPKVKISPYIYIYTYIQIYTHQLPKNRPPKIGRSETHPPGHCEEFVRIDDAQKTQGDLLRSRHHGRFTPIFYRVCVCVCVGVGVSQSKFIQCLYKIYIYMSHIYV